MKTLKNFKQKKILTTDKNKKNKLRSISAIKNIIFLELRH